MATLVLADLARDLDASEPLAPIRPGLRADRSTIERMMAAANALSQVTGPLLTQRHIETERTAAK